MRQVIFQFPSNAMAQSFLGWFQSVDEQYQEAEGERTDPSAEEPTVRIDYEEARSPVSKHGNPIIKIRKVK